MDIIATRATHKRCWVGHFSPEQNVEPMLTEFFHAAWKPLFLLFAISSNSIAHATVVRFDTTLGVINVRLYDTATPISVANFANYVSSGRWDGTIIHRSVPGFVIQGGGFSLTPDVFNATQVTKFPAIQNEFGISNLRGTIAYAKVGGNPHSATSEWFFNLADNSANLDNQNGGFTVFGRVLGNGMNIVDAIASLPRINAGGAFTDVPVTDSEQVIEQQNIFNSEAVVISSVSILDIPAGDYNFDGTVDGLDLQVLRADYGSTLKAEADGNGDGIVDGRDFLLWQRNYGQTSGTLGNFTSIPEPGGFVLITLALLGSALRRVRR